MRRAVPASPSIEPTSAGKTAPGAGGTTGASGAPDAKNADEAPMGLGASASASASASAEPLTPSAAGAQRPEIQTPVITLEIPYKLGDRPVSGGAAAEEERARWNRGGLGAPASDPPPSQGHPLPRVIIDVVRSKGPLPARDIQVIARRTLWIKVIGCYRLGAYKDQTLHGKTTVRFQVSRAGKVSRASVAGSTLKDATVAACLAREVNSLELPRKKAGSAVTATIQVHPGDDPMPPPESAVKAGPGALSSHEIQRVVGAARAQFEACYRASLEVFPELWGRIAIRFHVTASGKVDEAFETDSSFPDGRAARCVLREARALEFPPPAGGDARFVAPLRFAPK